MQIRAMIPTDVEILATLRTALWPTGTLDDHRQEALSEASSPDDEKIVLLAVDAVGGVCGFAEASLRHDYVNGCETSPVAFLEGLYIAPERRGGGVGRALCAAVEAWGRKKGCVELASDALLENGESHAFHSAIGFEETERVVYFRKSL